MSTESARCHGRARPWLRALNIHILHCHKTFLLLAMLTVAVWTGRACADGPSEADLGIVINEIHCNPDDEMELVEFVELYNSGTTDVSLSGWYFADGLTYTFAPRAWRDLEFDDAEWPVGQTAIGYGENFIITELSDMRGRYGTIYLRRSFEAASLDAFDTLLLEVKYDDGIIVWINGHLAMQGNVASSEMPHDATAESALENATFVDYTLSDLAAYLVEGTNVIAVQVVNASVSGSSDCFVDIRLTGRVAPAGGETPADGPVAGAGKYEIETVWESETSPLFEDEVLIPASVVEAGHTYRVRCRMQDDTGRCSHWSGPIQFEAGASLATGLSAGLRITEVMYNPADAPEDMDLDNDDFEFIELKNVGDETLDLSSVSFVEGVTFDFQDGTISEFEYRDEDGWPALADGVGHSLVPLAGALPGEPTGYLNDSANWRASTDIGSSPGRDDP